MPVVGSDAWIAAFEAVVVDAGASNDEALVVQQELTDTGAAWYVVVSAGGARVAPGRHPAPDVTFSQDLATATAVNRGDLSAQQAFIDGRLRVRGDVGRLTNAVAALSAFPPVEG